MESNYGFNVIIDYSGYGDKVYVVRYTDFPNVIGTGDTIEEAIEEAQGNLEVYLQYCEEEKIKELKEYMKNDIELTHKLIKETKEYEKHIEGIMEEYYDKCGIPQKYRNPNNIPGEIKIPTVVKNDLKKLKENKGEEIMNNIKLNLYDVVIITDKLGNIWQESIESIENMKDKVVYTTGKFYIEDVENNRIITAKNNLDFDNLHIIEVYRLTKQFTQIY